MDVAELVAAAQVRRRLPEPRERKAVREAAGVTRAELAAAIGVSEPTLWRWESGIHRPRGAALERYVSALDELRSLNAGAAA